MSDAEPIVLRSAANPTVRHLIRMRDNRARRRAGRVIVDGWRETAQAIRAGLTLCGVYLSENAELSKEDSSVKTVLQAAWQGHHRRLVSEEVMDRISYGQSDRGVVAEFEQPVHSLENLQIPQSPFIIVLDKVEKPGNVGAVFRCADAAGVDAVILCGGSGDPFNPNAIRGSLGAVFRVPSACGSEVEVEQFLVEREIRALAARVESSVSLWSADLSSPLALILGSEAGGLGNRWQRLGGQPIAGVQIPMSGQVDSLNVSVSAAVIAFEAARQRGQR